MDTMVVESWRSLLQPWRRIFTSEASIKPEEKMFYRRETEEEGKERPCIMGALNNWPKNQPDYIHDSWITQALRNAGLQENDNLLEHQVAPFLHFMLPGIGGNWTRLLYATRDLPEREQREILIAALDTPPRSVSYIPPNQSEV